MAAREQRHAAGSRRPVLGRRILRWIPELLVLLVVVAAGLQVQFDLGHRWFGLERIDPASNPAQVLAPAGLDLVAGKKESAVAGTLDPGAVDPAAVRAALAGLVANPELGKHLALRVVDLSNGEPVFSRGADAVIPASTMKLLTSAAALTALGPRSHFSTRVVATGNRIVLVGGGDPFLASSPARAKGYPVRADVTTLAQRTAEALTKRGITQVSLAYDASLFTGPAVNPHWPATYVPENVVPPISALWVDEARVKGRYVADPARAAVETFAAALRAHKIGVTGTPTERKAPAAATEIASVQSASVGEIVQQTLAVSDNNAAEVLARHVGAAIGGDASFVGGLEAIFDVLEGLGVDVTGSKAYDGSGLSRENKLTAKTLLDVLRVAASADHPKLREVLTGLPVAGFTGSLRHRFDEGPADAQGRVRAKTGTLTGVHGLAGIATDLDGNLMAFVFVADQTGGSNSLSVQHDLDLMAAALGACHCGV